jgi:hypothetical protein
MEMDMSDKIDDILLTPNNHALLMIDHQYLQLLALRSHPNEVVVSNSVFLAKAAKVFNVSGQVGGAPLPGSGASCNRGALSLGTP